MIKICAVVVWFNPDQKCVNNILSYIDLIDFCYIVDNSEIDNSNLAKTIPKSLYIGNMYNVGIAKALNIGCLKALMDGYEWCMTVDQDSYWNKTDLGLYFSNFRNLCVSKSTVKSFAATPNIQRSLLGEAKEYVKQKMGRGDIPEEWEYCDKVICSSNIISLSAWQEVKCFEEKLFIDEVDFDFCFKLREHGYEIIKFNSIFFFHTLGSGKRMILFSKDTHSSNRLYYMFRNRMYIIKYHPIYARKYGYSKSIIKLFIQRCIFDFNAIKNTKIFLKSRKAFFEL
jgi:rhamnosyltransferase